MPSPSVQSPAGPYAIGARPVSLTVADSMLSDSCSASVRVRDCEPPSITCAEPVQAECTGNGAATVALGEAQATDSCSAVSVSGPGSGSYPLGSTPLSYTATDAAGNTASCNTSVQVVDTQAPTHVLNGAASQTLECGASYMEQGSTATDVCSDVTGAVATTGDVNPLVPGTYERRYSVEDPAGNSGPELTRTVTVSDTLAPVLVLQGDAAQTLECGASYLEQGYTVEDVCAAVSALSVSVTGTVDPLVPGTYERHYSATDPAGNSSTALTRTVTVSDTHAPVLTLSGDANPTVACGASFNEPGYQANDVCEGDVSDQVVRTGSVDTAVPGSYPLSYSVADPSGNTSGVVRTVTVADNQGPTVVLNGAATMPHECGTAFDDPRATAMDACMGNVSDRLTISGALNVSQPGSYELTYNATDTSGNAGSPVSRTVNVSDTRAPVLALNGASPMLLECKQGGYAEPGATAVDGCSGPLSGSAIAIEQPVIDPAVLANHVVTYRATDSAGNVATAEREVRVQDTLPPVADAERRGHRAAGVQGGHLHRAGRRGLRRVLRPPDGQHHRHRGPGRVWRLSRCATGRRTPSGLVTEKVRDVRVVDTQPPTLTLGADPTEPVECSRGAFIDLGASAQDSCNGDVTHRITIAGTQQITGPGSYPITFGVTDLAGNAAPSITRNVNVKDTQAPVITINGQSFLDLECGVDTYTELGATAYDACQGDMTSSLQTYGNGANPAAVGTYSIEYGVWDATGNTRKALRTVKVSDRLPPVLTLLGSATMQHECASGVFVDPYATAWDACYLDLTSSIQRSGFVNAWALGTYDAHLQRAGQRAAARRAPHPHGARGGHAGPHLRVPPPERHPGRPDDAHLLAGRLRDGQRLVRRLGQRQQRLHRLHLQRRARGRAGQLRRQHRAGHRHHQQEHLPGARRAPGRRQRPRVWGALRAEGSQRQHPRGPVPHPRDTSGEGGGRGQRRGGGLHGDGAALHPGQPRSALAPWRNMASGRLAAPGGRVVLTLRSHAASKLAFERSLREPLRQCTISRNTRLDS